MKALNLSLLILILSLMACEKTVDSETNRWTRNQARLERLTSEYPNFSVAIQTQLQEAKTAFEKADQATEEPAKIELMAVANRIAAPSYISQLDNLDKKIEELRESYLSLIEYSENSKGVLIASIKSANIESTITESKNYLSTVQVKDKHQAQQAVTKVVSKLDRLQKSISQNLKSMKKAQKTVAE